MKNILMTGGAGFIGSHIADELISEGYEVTLIDNLSSTKNVPDYLNKKAKLIIGDVRSKDLMKHLVPHYDIIFHEAASVGIAQSNYEISDFVDNNCSGTANLLQAIIDTKSSPKLIISASNTTYGEGLYDCKNHGKFHPSIRDSESIKQHGFEPVCPECNSPAEKIPTPETTELNCNSIYALSKKFQEESAMLIGKMYGFPVVLLKYFNVFGPRQSLSNPYTGVSAIFMSRVKNSHSPIVYEDGNQTRDFISIHDVVSANMLAMENEKADYEVFNVGSGIPTKIKDLGSEICALYGRTDLEVAINGEFRKGDIRHCIADNSKIKRILKWTPKASLKEGLAEIIEWSKTQKAEDNFEKATEELKQRGLSE